MSDLILGAWVSNLIERSKKRGPSHANRWKPPKKLNLLIAGYNGARNTGEEVRVEEIVRQIFQIFGKENVQLTVLSLNPEYSRGYYRDATQDRLPFIFPPFLFREVPRYDGVITTCGSMFMSKFSNVHCLMMIEALGIASASEKLAIAYAGEAGAMDPLLSQICRRYCAQTAMIVRNEESRAVLQDLGISSQVGTDSAWTFEPLDKLFAEKLLNSAGWDGVQPVLAVCPNNPFWWPVKPSLLKTIAWTTTRAYGSSHYRSIYFHKSGPQVADAYRGYLRSLAGAMKAFCKERRVFPILVGMERLDADPCQRISDQLGGVPVFCSEQYDAFQLVSILRSCHLIASSRYHAVVTSMPGLVPSAGVSMDERIGNLMRERGHHDLLLETDDPQLEPKLIDVLNRLFENRESVSDAIGRTVVNNLKSFSRMGEYLEQAVRRHYPDFPARPGRVSWESYLPPMGPALRSLAERYSS
jgi:polysaccharide pyruvyl transferase WcaK-like protein